MQPSLHPLDLGADLCCDSAHKTLPVVTGGAYLHLAHDAPVQDEAAVRGALALFGSTSPSYLILQSLDACNAVLAGDYPRRLAQCCAALEGLRRSLNKAAAARQCPLPLAVAGAQQEPMKLTLDAAALGCTGTALAESLRRAQMECEYADPRYVVLMFTPENPPQDYTRLQTALEQLLAAVPAGLPRPENRAGEFAALQQQAVQRCTIRQAVLGAQVRVPVHKALGRVCAMPTVSCPPAIPVAVSGEEITPGGLQFDESLAFMEQAQQYCDLIHVSRGIVYDDAGIYTLPTYLRDRTLNVDWARRVRERLRIPVAVVGNFSTLDEAEQVIASGAADIVCAARMYLTDHEIIPKSLAGQPETARPCLRCHRGALTTPPGARPSTAPSIPPWALRSWSALCPPPRGCGRYWWPGAARRGFRQPSPCAGEDTRWFCARPPGSWRPAH